MGTIKNAVYKVDNGTDFDEIHFKTKAEQVVCNDGKTVEVRLTEVIANLDKKVIRTNGVYEPSTAATTLSMTLNLGAEQKGTFIIDINVNGNGRDANHSAAGTWLVKYLGGDVYKINTAELIGTVNKVGNAQGLSIANNGGGSIVITFTQTNSSTARFRYQITKIGEVV